MKTTITFLLLFLSALSYAQNKIYVHKVTTDNIVGTFQSLIDHPDLNNKPNAQVVVKQLFKNETGVYNNNPIGIAYSTFYSKWFVYNENQGNLPSGAFFNVFIGDNTDKFFVHVATSTNQGLNANSTVLDHPDLNNKEDSFVFISKNVLGSGSTVYNPYSYASAYDLDGTNKRELFESSAFQDIPNNAAFNVVVGTSENSFSHTSANSNIVGNRTLIDHSELNNNPDATFIFEHYWGTDSSNNGLINKNLGVWYNGSKWTIFTQDQEAMPTNVRFTILIASNGYTNIPDQNFEQALIDLGHDDVLDGKVLTTNISSLTSLNVLNKGITDLTGIQDFVALTNLDCSGNQLTNLNITKNTNLRVLYTENNLITNLNVSENTALELLWAYSNQLITIDVSNNLNLIDFRIHSNQFKNLDLSVNTNLTVFECFNTPSLEAINVQNGNNINMNTFNFSGNTNLTCIQVDDVTTINSNWDQDFTGYSADCYDTLSTEDLVLEKVLQLYPNPVQETLYIKATNEVTINEIQLYDVGGKMIRREKGTQENISLKELKSGIYFVKIITNLGINTSKIIKE